MFIFSSDKRMKIAPTKITAALGLMDSSLYVNGITVLKRPEFECVISKNYPRDGQTVTFE
jgi:hypothetical protein